jgi:ribosomal protein L7/L12
MEVELSADALAQIEAALFGGRKIEAIRLYREATGKGLLEAKNGVEALEAQLRANSPERFHAELMQEPGRSSGCMSMLLLLSGVIGGALLMLER